MTQSNELDRFIEEGREAAARATVLMDRDPKLPYISAYIIARDMMGSDRSLQWMREGMEWDEAERWCGSYGRLDLRVRALEEGLITEVQAYEGLASAWSHSDPDDTDPRFLTLWVEAFAANRQRYLRDHTDKRLPNGSRLTIYRGQDEDQSFGLSWSLNRKTAEKFANGAATREANRGGVVYTAVVDRRDVMGYMPGRGEAEVIVNPDDVRDAGLR